MKHLLVIPVLFSLIACGPVIEKIEDRTGGCVNGSCVNGKLQKPAECNNNGVVLTEFIGRNFMKVEKSSTGVEYISEYRFTNGNVATYIQTCTKGEAWTSVQLGSTFSYHPTKQLLQFDKPAKEAKEYGGGTCSAEITSEQFKVSYEGKCLVLTNAKQDKFYFPRRD